MALSSRTRGPAQSRRRHTAPLPEAPLVGRPARTPPARHRAPPAGGDQRAEVDRLVSLGATPVDIGQGDVDWV
ncbi:hypothetical protein PV720_46875, partial [Streptomyces europaeiscabiei]|nr:hypothetical protein [Streptomyces europaeiscabiei]